MNNYPVGSIYTETTGVNPGTTFGFGTWVAYGAGRVLVGVGTSDQAFTAGATGGESNHTLDVAEMPSHAHQQSLLFTESGTSPSYMGEGSGVNQIVNTTYPTGGGGAHNNLQPYIVVYMWERTA